MGRHREFDTENALDAAVDIFWQKGFEGTSLGDLSIATGVARPGLYSAFGNKEALFCLALDRYETKHLHFLSDALEEPTSYQVVACILRGTADIATQFPQSPGCMGLNGALACSEDAEPIRQELVRRRAANEAALLVRLERAKAEHDLPADVNCVTLAGFVMTLSHGLAVKAKAGASRKLLQSLVSYVLDTWPSRPPEERKDGRS